MGVIDKLKALRPDDRRILNLLIALLIVDSLATATACYALIQAALVANPLVGHRPAEAALSYGAFCGFPATVWALATIRERDHMWFKPALVTSMVGSLIAVIFLGRLALALLSS